MFYIPSYGILPTDWKELKNESYFSQPGDQNFLRKFSRGGTFLVCQVNLDRKVKKLLKIVVFGHICVTI